VHPAALGAVAARRALDEAGAVAAEVGDVWMGHGRQAGSGPNPARQVARLAGLADEIPAQTINKACASGLEAIVSAARQIALGEVEAALAGGIESMSRMPFLVDSEPARWGHRLGHLPLEDAMYRDGFFCPLANLIMGETAELLARRYGITREASDAFAYESQRKAAAAMAGGRFAREIVPVDLDEDARRGRVVVDADEHPRPATTLEGLAALPPVFPDVDGVPGIITAGSASGITDAGAALVLANEDLVARSGATPLARLAGWTTVGVDPRYMGIGPVPAVCRLLPKIGWSLDSIDLVEINEAFAPQVLAVLADLPVDPARLNVNGGAIALGHPIGCTGARIVVTLLHEMRRRGARRGLATLCVSGGMGMAVALEGV